MSGLYPIYNKIKSSQILLLFTSITFPKKALKICNQDVDVVYVSV
jgi:hypothetical protein